jgi:hypothetical protein
MVAHGITERITAIISPSNSANPCMRRMPVGTCRFLADVRAAALPFASSGPLRLAPLPVAWIARSPFAAVCHLSSFPLQLRQRRQCRRHPRSRRSPLHPPRREPPRAVARPPLAARPPPLAAAQLVPLRHLGPGEAAPGHRFPCVASPSRNTHFRPSTADPHSVRSSGRRTSRSFARETRQASEPDQARFAQAEPEPTRRMRPTKARQSR